LTERVRVVHVITRLIVGGAQEAAILACARVDRDEFESVLVIGPQTGSEGSLRPMADELGVPVVVVPDLVREIAPRRDRRALHQLRQVLRDQRPDIVHTHSSKAGVLGRRAAQREQVPAVVHTVHGWSFHDHMPRWRRAVYRRLERRAARWSDRIITISELDREKGLGAGIGTPEQYDVIHELNDLARYDGAGAPEDARAQLGLPSDAFVVGTVGRLSEQKDPLTWIRVAAQVAEAVPAARFVMVGDGPLRPDVERRAAELGIGDALTLTGLRDDVPDLLPAFDVFLLTSRWEGLPLVIPQAMASGIPVVASTADGNREAVRARENGLLASPGDPAGFAGAVLELRDRALASRLVAAGRTTARDFALERTIPELEQVYLRLARPRQAGLTQAEPPPRTP
jgi:glycosyltransferase involved in cell wall biosynthesis